MLLPKLFHFFSKTLLATFLTLFCAILIGYVSPVYAQNANSAPVASDVVINSHTRSQIQLIEFSSALICQLIGIDLVNPTQGCLGVNSVTGQIGYSPLGSQAQLGGLMGLAIGGIAATYQPPASTSQFTHYLASNFGILKPVIAADPPGTTGSFGSFAFLQQLFITTRDLTFMLLVILFIVIGIAIMLRLKIDPRTVMSIQNQIPKIIIGIVLISFSYALAGFLTDMMWVVTYFSINTIGGIAQQECTGTVGIKVVDPLTGTETTTKSITEVASRSLLNSPLLYAHNIFNTGSCFGNENGGMWSGLWGLSNQVSDSLGGILTSTVFQALGGGLSDITVNKDCSIVDYFLHTGACVKADAFQFVSFIIGAIAKIVVVVAILLALTRVWFSLIKAYAYILLDIITAPIQIGIGLFPGGKMGFSRWIRHVLAYLLVFPATATILVLASVFALNRAVNNPTGNATFLPPFLGNPFAANNLGALIAFGLILITPELLEMIKDALQVKNSDRATKAVSSGFGRGLAPTAALGTFGKELFGKDKNGQPKVGSLLAGGMYKKYAGPDTKLGQTKLVALGRRRVQDYRAKKMDLQQDQGHYIDQQAEQVKQEELYRIKNKGLITNPDHAHKLAEYKKREFLISKRRLNENANARHKADLQDIALKNPDYQIDPVDLTDINPQNPTTASAQTQPVATPVTQTGTQQSPTPPLIVPPVRSQPANATKRRLRFMGTGWIDDNNNVVATKTTNGFIPAGEEGERPSSELGLWLNEKNYKIEY